MKMKFRIGPRANNGHPSCSATITVGDWTLKVGTWAYGWENPAYYKRFDHVRFVSQVWKKSAREGERFYGAHGFDRTLIIRDDGRWCRPRLHRGTIPR